MSKQVLGAVGVVSTTIEVTYEIDFFSQQYMYLTRATDSPILLSSNNVQIYVDFPPALCNCKCFIVFSPHSPWLQYYLSSPIATAQNIYNDTK